MKDIDVDYLIRNNDKINNEDLCKVLNVTRWTLGCWQKRLGLKKDKAKYLQRRSLTRTIDVDEDYIRKNYNKMDTSFMADVLGVSINTIQRRMKEMELVKDKKIYHAHEGYNRRSIKDDDDIKFIIDNFHTMSSVQLGEKFHCNKTTIAKIWMSNGLHRDAKERGKFISDAHKRRSK